jgi:signal transduction histidine kinase
MRPVVRLDPFGRFLVAVLLCSGLAVAVLGGAVDRLLTRNVLDREARVTAEAVRLLANLDLTAEQFHSAVTNEEPWVFQHVVKHLTSIPEIMRIKIYDAQGTIVWSDEARAIGMNFRDNHELAEALEGEIEVEMGLLKAEHVYEAERYDERRLLEVYVPLLSPDGTVYGVFEVYKHPVTFFRNLDAARRMLLFISLAVGAALFASLARIYLRARRTEIGLHARNREIEAQLVQAEKLGVVGEMAAAIAHEINNPLGILMGKVRELQSVADQRGCPEICREDFGAFGRELARIGEVLRGLLLFARKSEMRLAPTDVNQVVGETVRFAGPSFARADVTIVHENHAPVPLVRADANQLKQVFLNLLQNAKDAMPQGGTIRLRTQANNGQVNVEVIDSGTGIPPEIVNRIFDPFFSTKQRGDGSGLGLSVSYGIIKAHGGNIEVNSQLGHGSVFRVVLPALA